MIDNTVYIDIAGYHSLDAKSQEALGITPDGENEVGGIAPYWRVAYTKAAGNQAFEAGLFGLQASTYPNRMKTFGEDHFLDLGFDTEYRPRSAKTASPASSR